MSDKEAKVIQMPQASILNSPLLQGEEVEIKDYTKGLANMATAKNETTETTKEDKKEPAAEILKETVTEQQKVVAEKKEVSEWEGKDFSYSQPNQPPPTDDDVEEMQFNPEEEYHEAENEKLNDYNPTQKANEDADMLVMMFNQFVPQLLGDALKTDTAKVRYVMKYNEIPEVDIKEIEDFLNTSNAQITKALLLTPQQVNMLKPALAKVLERHSLTPENPLINLAIVIASIAIQKIMTIKQILAEQTTHLQMIIKGYQLKLPKGYEDIAEPKTVFRIRRKKKESVKQAA